MKPSLPITERKTRRDSVESVRRPSRPNTDYHFQSGSFERGFGRSGREPLGSFRGISEEYFRTEARSHFAIEAALFGLIVMTVAVPVFQGVRGLVQYVWGIL